MSVRGPGDVTRVAVGGLAESIHRVDGLQSRASIRAELPSGPSRGQWRRCAELLDDPALFTGWHDRLGDWLRARHGAAPKRTAAGYVMSWYLHVPAYAAALLLHHERRVPALRPAELAFRLSGDRPHPDGIAVLGTEFHCLPSDPGSGLPEATVVADEHELVAVLRARYIAHAARFVRAYRKVSPLGPRMLWAAATDALDNSLWWAGRHGGDEGAGVADAAFVLDAVHPPLTSASTLRRTDQREWVRRRESCCFSYLLPAEAECDGCPRTCSRRQP